MSEILGRLDRTIKSQGPDSLLVQAREALHAAYETIAELRQDVETWRRRCAEETLAWTRADTKAQAFDRIALAFQESIDPDDGIVNEPQDLFDLIDSLSRGMQGRNSRGRTDQEVVQEVVAGYERRVEAWKAEHGVRA